MTKKKYLTPILLDLGDGGSGEGTGQGSGEGGDGPMDFDEWMDHFEGNEDYDYNKDGSWDWDDYVLWLEEMGW